MAYRKSLVDLFVFTYSTLGTRGVVDDFAGLESAARQIDQIYSQYVLSECVVLWATIKSNSTQ